MQLKLVIRHPTQPLDVSETIIKLKMEITKQYKRPGSRHDQLHIVMHVFTKVYLCNYLQNMTSVGKYLCMTALNLKFF